MNRPTFCSCTFIFLVVLAATLNPAAARAQATATGLGIGDITSDPFTFYYAYYLPNQQIQAMRPKPIDTINQAVQARQYYAATQRQSLYNPISPYTEEYDPLRPYSQQQGRERVAQPYRFVQDPSNSDGSGPSLYYGRASQYYPGLRIGRGPNANIARIGQRRGGRGLGGGGMGGFGGMGMPGMGMPGMGGFM
jgi:hypothetical protein